MGIKRVILFRFYKEFKICLNRLELLKFFNPKTTIFGIFGGEKIQYQRVKKIFQKELADVHFMPFKDPRWKWLHGDLTTREWFISVGKNSDFEMLHVIDWDLLLFGAIDKIYKHIKDGVGLTGLTPLNKIEDRWHWTKNADQRKKWLKSLKRVRAEFGYNQEPYACLGPGVCYSYEFLKKFSQIKPLDLVIEELSIPVSAQILKQPLYNTGFYPKWFDHHWHKIFNCLGRPIKLETIIENLKNPKGARVFHPCQEIYDFNFLINLIPKD